MSEKRTPEIRFKGYTDPWEQRKLGDLAVFNPKTDLPDEFEYVDLESVVGTEMLSHRTESKRTAPSRAQRLAQTGDLFYQTVRPYQKNNYLFEKPDRNYVFSTGYAQMRPVTDGRFLLCLVQNECFVKVVLDNCTGTSYPAINSNDLAQIDVYAPRLPQEQRQIGNFFKYIDTLITLHQRKYDKLMKVKKAMLEKMFPQGDAKVPEIRFAGFTDPWEQRKFSDIAETRRGLTYSPSSIRDSGVRVLRSSNIAEDQFIYGEDDVFVDPDAVNIPFANQSDILITSANGSTRLVGKHTIIRDIPVNSAVHGGFMLLATAQNPEFVNALMSAPWYAKFISLFVAGGNGAIGNLNKNDLDEQDVLVPKEAEQRIIGQYFNQFDTLITLHQRKLEKLKNLKSAMLSKMFV